MRTNTSQGAMTLTLTTLSQMTFSIMGFIVSIDKKNLNLILRNLEMDAITISVTTLSTTILITGAENVSLGRWTPNTECNFAECCIFCCLNECCYAEGSYVNCHGVHFKIAQKLNSSFSCRCCKNLLTLNLTLKQHLVATVVGNIQL